MNEKQNQALTVLGAHLNKPVDTIEERAALLAQFDAAPYKDGWLFRSLASKKGAESGLWWMVVGQGVCEFFFFKMANPRAYAQACALNKRATQPV